MWGAGARSRQKLLIVSTVKINFVKLFLLNQRPRTVTINLQTKVAISLKWHFCLEEKCKYLRKKGEPRASACFEAVSREF